MRNGLPLHTGMSIGQKQRLRKNKKAYCHAVQPKLQSQKKWQQNTRDNSYTPNTKKVVKNNSSTSSFEPLTGTNKKSPGICKPDTTLWYQPIRNICNGQIGSWNPKDPGWTKKNNSWVATTQDTARFFSLQNFPTGPGTWSEYEYWNVPTRQHWSWSEWRRAGPGVPCDLITERQRMIGVCNHLRNARYLGSITILRRWARIPRDVWSLGPFQFMGLVV